MTLQIRHIVCCIGLVWCQAASAGLPETVARIKLSIVGVGTYQPSRTPPLRLHGTGFVVGDGNTVLTSAHVIPRVLDIEHNERVVALFGGRAKTEFNELKLIRLDEDHDVGLLRFQGNSLPVLQLGNSEQICEGTELAFTGFPIGAVLGLYPVTHRALVSSITPIAVPVDKSGSLTTEMIRRLNSPFNVFQLDATAYPGNSGGPLFDPDSGEVVGIMNMVFVKETKESVLEHPSGISYAIPGIYAKRLLEEARSAAK